MNKVIVTIVTAVACAVCTLAGTTGENAEWSAETNRANIQFSVTEYPVRIGVCTPIEETALSFATFYNANNTNGLRIVSFKVKADNVVTFRVVSNDGTGIFGSGGIFSDAYDVTVSMPTRRKNNTAIGGVR